MPLGACACVLVAISIAGTGGCDSDEAAGDGHTLASSSSIGAGGEVGAGTGGRATGGSGGGEGGATPGLSPEVEACLFVNACEAEGGSPMGMQACIAHAYERQWHWASYGDHRLAMEAMDCRLAATDCEGVRACDAEPSDFDADCAAVPGQTLCVGDTWVICAFDGAATAALDCAASGRSCNVDVWAGCGTEPCTFGATPNSCDPAEPKIVTICNPSGFLERVDCARQNNFVLVHGTDGDMPTTIAGEVCGDDPMLGDKGCVGQGEACDFFSQTCEGDTLVTCAGGALAHRDCGALEPGGQSCGYVTEGPFAGGAACGVVESACDPSGPEACEDGVISFCSQGKAQEVSCADAGFAGCETATYGERTVAFCTP